VSPEQSLAEVATIIDDLFKRYPHDPFACADGEACTHCDLIARAAAWSVYEDERALAPEVKP